MAEEADVLTGIDALVKYLNEHGEVESNALGAALSVSERNIEDWAKILEKANLVKITYKLGKMFVAPVSLISRGEPQARQMADIKRAVLESEIAVQLSDINKISQRIEEFSKFVSASENVFKTKAGDIREAVERIEKLQREAENNYKSLNKRKEQVDKFAEELESRLDSLKSNAEGIESFAVDPSNAMSVIQDIKQKLESFEDSTRELLKRSEESMREQRRRMLGLVAGIKDEDHRLREMMAGEERLLEEYRERASLYRRDAEVIKKRVERERGSLMDAVAKTKDEVDRLFTATEKEVQRLGGLLEASKKGFGGFVELNEKLSELRSNINGISKDKEQIRKQLELLMQELKALEGESGRAGGKSLDEIEKKARETSKRLDKAANSMRDIRQDIDKLTK